MAESHTALGCVLSRRKVLRSLAAMGLAGWTMSYCREAEGLRPSERELFDDPKFAQGFGAAWPYGERFSTGARQGQLLGYRDIAPYHVHLIPEGPVKPGDTRCHPWDFEEGMHENFTDASETVVRELHEHRLAVNHVLEINSAERLQFAQFNNYRLAANDPQWNGRLVKRVTSDRRGMLRMYYNSQNEIRNAAIAYLPQWAHDTWPHFLLVQRFVEKPHLGDFKQLDFSLSTRVLSLEARSDWPTKEPGGTPPEMNLLCYFLLHDAKARPLWVGVLLHASRAFNYFIHTDREQWGMAFYREPLFQPDEAPTLGRQYHVTRELRSFVGRAIDAVAAKFGPGWGRDVDEYRLVLFNIGWEGIGHWECECELSGLSLRATPQH